MFVYSDNIKLTYKFLGREIDLLKDKKDLPEGIKSLHHTLLSKKLPTNLS